jgi:hypothetical protein
MCEVWVHCLACTVAKQQSMTFDSDVVVAAIATRYRRKPQGCDLHSPAPNLMHSLHSPACPAASLNTSILQEHRRREKRLLRTINLRGSAIIFMRLLPTQPSVSETVIRDANFK